MKGHHTRIMLAGGSLAAAGTTTYEHINLFTELWAKVPPGWQNCVCFAAGGLILPIMPKLLRSVAGALEAMYQDLLGESRRNKKNPPAPPAPPRGTPPPDSDSIGNG